MKYKTRILSALLAASLCLSLVGCAAKTEAAPAVAAPTAAAAPTTAPAAAKTVSRNADAADKEESVHVEADADGTARKITVETVLNYDGRGGDIVDRTDLTDIKNTEGDEEFTLARDGTLLWEDHGEHIRYKGTGGRELPVALHLTYWLDGREIAPAELAGKSGHLRIRFDYENRTEQTVTVTHADLSDEDDDDPAPPETEEVRAPIPFLALSMVMLPEDVFANVKIENGRLLTLGDSTVAIGCAFPGLAEALDLTSCELTEDMEIPSYVELEADVTDFSLDFTATILSNGLLNDLEPEDLDDIKKLTDGMKELADAADEIADGADELADGAREFADGTDALNAGLGEFAGYIRQYVSGVGQAGDGAKALRDGLAAVSGQTGSVREAAGTASAQLAEVRSALDELDIPEMDSAADALEAVIAAIDTLEAELASLSAYPDAVRGVVSAADDALADVDLDLSGALDDLDLTGEQRAQVLAAADAALSGARSSVDEARSYLASLPDASADADLTAQLQAIAQGAAALREKAESALDAAAELPGSPDEALDRLDELLTGAVTLCGAIDQLADGADALSSGLDTLTESGAALTTAAGTVTSGASALADGADALADGARELADGLDEFNDEGISEITDLANDDLAALVTRIRALREADLTFDNYGGIADGRTGSVRFLIETDGIE